MNCEEAKILSIAHILGDLDPDSEQYHQLESHLASCPVCTDEYKSNKWTIEFIEKHQAIFAEVLRTPEERKAAEQEEIKRSWQGVQAKLAKFEAQEKQVNLRRTLWKVTAAAACVIIGISAWLMLSNSKTLQKPTPQQKIALAPTLFVKIEQLTNNGNIFIPDGTQIKTRANELKTLIINNKHQMVMNANTTLLIDSFEQNSHFGCVVKLVSGEVFAHVEHDGNPFVVATGHGSALIIGTVFDIKTTDISTTLVVAEGTVQFGSEEGFVEVTAGHTSEIVAQSAPTKPVSCSTAELTAWATGHELKTALAKIGSSSDAYDLTDFWLSAMSDPINLEAIDYEDWIEKRQAWFKREFPWVFQLRDALAKERIDVDYPELLIQSGDIWQFVYSETSPQQIPILYFGPLLKTASKYGFNKQWLMANIPAAKFAIDDPAAVKGRFTGLEAFEEWAGRIEQMRRSSEPPDSAALLYSLHASVYLANTRTLGWMCLMNGEMGLLAEDKAKVLALLQTEVNTANELAGRVIRLFAASENQPCDDRHALLDGITEIINTIADIEKGVSGHDVRK